MFTEMEPTVLWPKPIEQRFPLTLMWLAGHTVYPNLVAYGLPYRVVPWWFDIMNEYNRVMK